ncbi:hypothetical protein BSNK01_00050 [Bacillaceae bacterium]
MKKIVTLLFSITLILSIVSPTPIFAETVTLKGGKLIENRTFLPLRDIFETLNAEVIWDAKTRKITARQGEKVITLQIGSKTLMINEQKIQLDTSPKIVNNKAMVPIRFVAQSLGSTVVWDNKENVVYINSPEKVIVVQVDVQSQLANVQKVNQKQKPKNTGVGNLKGTITWQYNEFIGTKPDVEAHIYVIPYDFNKNNFTQNEINLYTMIGIVPENSGLYYKRANGYGQFEINGIPAGKYIIVVVSNNTHRNPDEPISEYVESLLKDKLDWDNFKKFRLDMNKHEVDVIEIKPNQTEDFSHDFGYTYF